MNEIYELKRLLADNGKPISDYKLLEEYKKENNLEEKDIIEFTKTYVKSDYPLQYLVGFEYFFNSKVFVTPDVLIPRMETEEVVLALVNEIKLNYNPGSEINLLDLCTGSGCIVLGINELIGQEYKIQFWASDISKEALKVAKKNFDYNNLNVKLIHSDLLEYFIEYKITFDVIISNPPYVSYDEQIDNNVVKYEPSLALFASDNGLYIYNKIIYKLDSVLNEQAIVCFEIGRNQGEVLKKNIINSIKFKKNVIINDINDIDRIVLLSR